jgi:glycosyltransferase involved in cell wall biosynthesis
MSNKTTKICMNAMVANESHVILRMLESCYQHIDYWVVQDNGSTDGTQDIIRNFFAEKGIPGYLYETEWQYPGFNRDHTLQECLKADHGCDWILRMDADEQLVVDDDFDWEILNDTSIQSFNITAQDPGGIYYRTWLWNAKLPWYFKHDKRHEIIFLSGNEMGEDNFQIVNLPRGFRHIITNDGQTWDASLKFLNDALILEADQVCSGKINDDDYHLFYIGKSYADTYQDQNFPFGKNHGDEYARRAIYYLEHYVRRRFPVYDEDIPPAGLDEMCYFSLVLIGQAYKFIGNRELAYKRLEQADWYCPFRNEHWVILAEMHAEDQNFERMYEITTLLMGDDRVCPFPDWYFLLWTSCYKDTSDYVQFLHNEAMKFMGFDETQTIQDNQDNLQPNEDTYFPGEI